MGEGTGDLDLLEGAAHGWPDDQIDVVMDVSDYVAEKWEAVNCHRTQFGPDNLFRRLPEDQVKEAMSREYFGLGRPQPHAGRSSDDLFFGIDASQN